MLPWKPQREFDLLPHGCLASSYFVDRFVGTPTSTHSQQQHGGFVRIHCCQEPARSVHFSLKYGTACTGRPLSVMLLLECVVFFFKRWQRPHTFQFRHTFHGAYNYTIPKNQPTVERWFGQLEWVSTTDFKFLTEGASNRGNLSKRALDRTMPRLGPLQFEGWQSMHWQTTICHASSKVCCVFF